MCLIGIESRSPAPIAEPNGPAKSSATSSTCRQMKRSPSLGSRAPGSSPASQRTWKPLQMPSTGPPSAAKRATASIAGEKRAIAPARR